jgi:general secretion pathway protein D
MKKHRILYLVILFSAAFLWSGCAAQKAYKRGQEAAKRGEWDRAVAQYIIALNKKPDNPQYRVGFERARLAASQFHFQKAKQLASTSNYEQSVIEYQLALDFDPTNQFIANELKNARTEYEKQLNIEKLTEIEKAKEEAKKKTQIYKVLGPEAETTVQSLKFHDDSLKNILDSLGALAGINIVYDSDFRDQEFSVSLDNITFRNALEQILVANRLYFKPLDQSTILIVPDNPQKRRQYDEQVIQTFYLSNAELNDVLNLIRSVMQIQRIATNPQLNAITLRDTPDKIAIAQKIIEANDKSRSEILLNIEILEVDRDRALNYGVNLSTYSVSQVLNVTGDPETSGVVRGDQFRGIDAASWTFTIPGIIYSALVTDQYTRLLATPQIRASEGQQVAVRLGDRVPIPVNVIQTAVAQPGQAITTFPTTTFQQQDIGINIDVTPRVHHNREISLTMRFELTSITALGSVSIPPTIGNRTVNTVIRLKDGETNLLAGLLRRDERKSLRGLPGIHKIPILRDLFANNDKTLQEKDIIFTITPHILRTPNITAEDLAPIWIGTEDDIRLKTAPPISVFERSERQQEETIEDIIRQEREKPPASSPTEPQEVPETNLPEATKQEPQPQVMPEVPAPVTPETVTPTPPAATPSEKKPVEQVVPPVTPAPQPKESEGSATTLSFLSLNLNPKVDQEVILNLRAENGAQLANAFLFFEFDPSAIQVKDVLQGAFMTPGAFAKSFDNSRGVININATHVPADASSGVVATIVLRPIKPGQTTIKLNSAVLRTETAVVIPVTFVPFTLTVE